MRRAEPIRCAQPLYRQGQVLGHGRLPVGEAIRLVRRRPGQQGGRYCLARTVAFSSYSRLLHRFCRRCAASHVARDRRDCWLNRWAGGRTAGDLARSRGIELAQCTHVPPPPPGAEFFLRKYLDFPSSVMEKATHCSSHRDTPPATPPVSPPSLSANDGCLDRSRRLRTAARYGRPGALLEEAQGG